MQYPFLLEHRLSILVELGSLTQQKFTLHEYPAEKWFEITERNQFD